MKSRLNNIIVKFGQLITFILIVILFVPLPAYSIENKSSPNYFIILIHGIGENNDSFSKREYGDLENYLKYNLGLSGYVYSFAIKDRYGSSIDGAKQVGGKTGVETWTYNDQTKSYEKISNKNWLDTAKDIFTSDFYKKHGRDPIESEIPDKYILIAHSMGGLAARYFITSDYYNNNVIKLITIDTPHLGADGVVWYKKFQTDDGVLRNMASPFMDIAIQNLLKSFFALPLLEDLYVSSGHMTANAAQRQLMKIGSYIKQRWKSGISAIQLDLKDIPSNLRDAAQEGMDYKNSSEDPENVIEYWGGGVAFWLFILNHWDANGTGLMEMDPEGPFIAALKQAKLKEGLDPIEYRLISARGCPTPHRDIINRYGFVSPYIAGVMLPFMSEYHSLPTEAQKVYSAMLSVAIPGGWGVKDGSMLVGLDSSRGEGVEIFKNNTKRYDYLFRNPNLDIVADDTKAAYIAIQVISTFFPNAKFLTIAPTVALSASTLYSLYEIPFNNDSSSKKLFFNHGYMIGKVTEGSPSIIEQALDDTPLFGGSAVSENSKSNISASSVNTPTASFNDFDQAFVLLSDLDSTKKPTGSFHTVTIEAFTNGSSGISFPIEVKGQKNWVSAVTVKEAPTAIKGVINTFLPKKLKHFNYSENFAAWKPVGAVDEWGNFTIRDLKLAEGQNVIAFDAESWTGNRSNQHLKIILNTIPMVASEFSPLPGTFLKNNQPTISGKFAKASYSESAMENVNLLLAKLLIGTFEVDVTEKVKTIISGGAYDKQMRFEYLPENPLPDGQYSLVVVANSNVGISQAVIDFTIDTVAPALAVQPLPPYSPRAPATIRWSASDEASPNLVSIRCDLYDSNNNYLTNIATAESLSKGDNYFTLDPAKSSKFPADGKYKIKVKVLDLAGNTGVAATDLIIDSTPPIIIGAGVTPNPMTSKTTDFSLAARIDEKATVSIKLNNISNNSATIYLTQAVPAPDGNGNIAVYNWKYDTMFMKGPEDGLYNIELMAKDEAGNESILRTMEAIRIDRTAPKIYGQITNPYVLSNIGTNAYKTKLSYNLSEAKRVRIKVYNANTGELVDDYAAVPSSNTSPNEITWDGSSSNLPKGAYKFQIIAEDDVGNIGIAYASCVKDGIAPVISYPAVDYTEVSGTISIRGTAIDPDWTNDRPFKQYRVICKKGASDLSEGVVEVPLINRGTSATAKNISLRPLQNDSTLAYLHTNLLEDGEYTIFVVVEEEGGESLAATRVINVNNDEFASSIKQPYVKLKPIPSEITFKSDDTVELPISFINSVKPSNVYVEVLRSGSLESVAFFKYFPNVQGAPFIGKPEYKPGSDLGYFIWYDESGYHIRWSTDGNLRKFTGNIITIGGSINSPVFLGGGQGITVSNNIINWDASIFGDEGGIDFTLNSGQIMITAKIDEEPNYPSTYAENVYLGISKYEQQFMPIVINAANQRLVDILNAGKSAEPSNYEKSIQTVEWNGKLDTGAYVDNGTYIVKVRAEGVDGVGVATDEKLVEIKTPFELAIKEIAPVDRKFSTIGAPDRLSVFYSISKDSIINANVYDSAGNFISKLIEGEEVLGTSPNNSLSLTWRGNYPDSYSGMMVTGGNYKIKLNIAAKDGSGSEMKEIDNISIVEFKQDDNVVNLDPIGEEVEFYNGSGVEKIRLASGDSPFYFEAKGIGKYYPPKDFSYTVTAAGEQRFTAYPYVPFAALMHRGFNSVDVQVEVIASVHYSKYNYVLFQGWKEEGQTRTRQYVETFSLTNQETAKEVKQQYDILEFHDAALRGVGEPDGHVNKIDLTVIFRPARNPGWVLDIVTIEAAPNVNSSFNKITSPITVPAIPTVKGIFKVTPTWGTWGQNFGRRPFFSLGMELEAPIDYSRLTNRFVPWFGFVSKLHPLNEVNNFSGYLNDLSKLGFPGKDYFVGSKAASTTAPHRKSYDKNILSLSVAKVLEIESKTNSGLSGSASDYTSYLSDEYLEFIPLSSPQNGYFEYEDKQIDGKLSLTKQNAYPITAKTVIQYNDNGNPPSPFKFSWPWNEGEYIKFTKQQLAKRKLLDNLLGGNPQNYTGPTADGTWWELDPDQIAQRKLDQSSVKNGFGQVRFDKSVNKSVWTTTESFDQFLPLPSYVAERKYNTVCNIPGIKIYPESGRPEEQLTAEDKDTIGIDWTTDDDTNLIATGGLIRSQLLIFNYQEFRGKRSLYISSGKEGEGLSRNLSLAYPLNEKDYRSINALKYTFLTYDIFKNDGATPVDNPNVVINNWELIIKDKTGRASRDYEWGVDPLNSKRLHDTFTLKLKLDALENRYVEVRGYASNPYELLYYDGINWKSIYDSKTAASGHLAWWDVSRLNGKYTVLLRSGNYIASQNIEIGTLVKREGGDAYSTYKRAQLKFPVGAFLNGSNKLQDQIVTVTPVSIQEIFIRNRPIILTSGPIVEIKPSPWKFTVSSAEGIDQRPTLRFIYAFDELKELKVWDGAGTPSNIPWNIHQVTAAGDLQVITNNKQEIENNNGEMQYAFYAPLDHFSTYALLPGTFKLSAPIVLADHYITNKNTVTIYGTAEPGSIITLYVKTENLVPNVEKGEFYVDRISAEAKTGSFKFTNVKLLQEGENYIYLTAHLSDNKGIRTCSQITIVKDISPPKVEVSQSLYAFSPNGDGRYDSVDYRLKSNENGKLCVTVISSQNTVIRNIFNLEISSEANKEIKLLWGKDSFDLYRRDSNTGIWLLVSNYLLNERLSDGGYAVTAYAIDEAGNISNNYIAQTLIDTTPPKILELIASPNPFTPNDDGVNDRTKFYYKLSEPVYVHQKIYRDDGKLFFSHEGPTEKYIYPTNENLRMSAAAFDSGSWQWNGRGLRSELLGGIYNYEIYAEDSVGNGVTSEAKSLSVNCNPTLIPYVYAEPDPFAPVNPNNNFTEIKYFLARDNLKVKVMVTEQEGNPIKILVADQIEGKGEHLVRWYGDFNSNYKGATAVKDNYRVADGSYQFKVTAEDINEIGAKTAEASNTILVDNIPPQIVIKTCAVDYPNKKVNLIYSVPEKSLIEVSVCDQNENLISSIISNEAQAAGEHMLAYTSNSNQSDVGKYYFKIRAADLAMNISEIKSSYFQVDNDYLRFESNSAQPSTFTPNGDGLNDITKISYKIAGGLPDYNVNINIVNAIGSTVKSLVINDPEGMGSYSFYWDGKNDEGKLAGDGDYEYIISATDKKGSKIEERGRLLLVTTQPVVDITTSMPIFSPNEDNYNDTINFNYSLNYATFYLSGEGLVKLDVYDLAGNSIWNKIFSITPGSYSYQWDGSLNNSNEKINSGTYYIQISGQDPLGAMALPKAISFEVDNKSPEVLIAYDLIANPGNFATNANPDGSDRPRSTTFYYSLSESTKVSVKVYKVRDDQTNYIKADFNDSNLVNTLISDIWQEGAQSVSWDGKTSDSNYALPGKYAFIVEGVDRENNPTLYKWGGTVWIQNNVLTLTEPEQINNPDPQYISPNGNGSDPIQKRSRLYFTIPLTLNPATIKLPEKIEAMEVGTITKKVGKYSVKVYSDNTLNNLVRMITSEADAYSGTLIWEDWDGKNDAGQFVADGMYYLVVDVKDYANNPALNNLLMKTVVVDNSIPTVSNLSVSNYYFSAGNTINTDPAKQNTVISYRVGDNNSVVYTTVDILRSGIQKAILMNVTSQETNANYTKIWSGEGYDIDGTYTYRVTTTDLAGNFTSAEGSAVLDRTEPIGTIVINNNAAYTITPAVTLNLNYSDTTSGIDQMSFSDNGTNWNSWEAVGATKAWNLPGSDGAKSVFARYSDKAGNFVAVSDTIVLDTVDPYFNSGPTISDAPVNSWSTHSSPNFNFSATDATSGVKEIHAYVDDIDQGAMASYTTNWHPLLNDGIHTVKLRLYDNAGRFTDSSTYTFKIDTKAPSAPSVSVAHTPVASWSNHNSPYLTWSDPGDGNGSGVSYYRGFIDGVDQGTVTSGWEPTLSDGGHVIYVRAVDGVNLTKDSSLLYFYIDTQAPFVSQPANGTFNPYVDGNIQIDFTASDPSPSSGISASNIYAKIKYDTNIVKNLNVYSNGGNSYYVVWDGTNDYGDYVNEGDYVFMVKAKDQVGNESGWKEIVIQVKDDIRMTDNIIDSTNPYLTLLGNTLNLKWIEGWDDSTSVTSLALVDWGGVRGVRTTNPVEEDFTVNFNQEVSLECINYGRTYVGHYKLTDLTNGITLFDEYVYGLSSGGNYKKWVGTRYLYSGINYRLYAEVIESYDWVFAVAENNAYYKKRKFNQYARASLNLGENWGNVFGPEIIESMNVGTTEQSGHSVWSSGNQIWYKKGSSSNVKITNSSGIALNPVIAVDGNGNAYVAWQDNRNGNWEIYFQKIPFNFAPVSGNPDSVVQSASVNKSEITISLSTTLESPVLISPDNNTEVPIIRPTFSWKHMRGDVQEYKIDLAKDSSFSMAHQSFVKSAASGSPDNADPNLYYYTYQIHEFDPGLDRDTYYWEVTALTTNEAATSEVGSFTIVPDLSLSDVTNYPNPFNPVREKTKIRYRLGADADEVKIRIYDITGSLVREITDCSANGEGSSVWDKYNDVEWDGRNGRGDVVVNGIYPFEVVARLGNKTVNGRGKVAVLK